jgi:hypothetical protein
MFYYNACRGRSKHAAKTAETGGTDDAGSASDSGSVSIQQPAISL